MKMDQCLFTVLSKMAPPHLYPSPAGRSCVCPLRRHWCQRPPREPERSVRLSNPSSDLFNTAAMLTGLEMLTPGDAAASCSIPPRGGSASSGPPVGGAGGEGMLGKWGDLLGLAQTATAGEGCRAQRCSESNAGQDIYIYTHIYVKVNIYFFRPPPQRPIQSWSLFRPGCLEFSPRGGHVWGPLTGDSVPWQWLWTPCGCGWRMSASRTACLLCRCWPWSSAAFWDFSWGLAASPSRSVQATPSFSLSSPLPSQCDVTEGCG